LINNKSNKKPMTLYNFKPISLILFLVCLFLCNSAILAKVNSQFAYVLFGQSTEGTAQPMARVILDGDDQQCPKLSDGTVMTARVNPDSVNFPITVCESLYPFSKQLSVAGQSLPMLNKEVNKVTVFGDTGCKSSHQDCSLTSSNWPFPSFVQAASKSEVAADVILHMGDYNYSGTPGNINITGIPSQVSVYDAGDNTTQGMCQIPGAYYGQNSVGSQFPDSWPHWQTNFFAAAAPLFSKSPWVFARGNHELCSRAGPGWFYLLDPNSSLLGEYQSQLSCPAANNPTPTILSTPYVVELGNLNVAVLDSANACDYGLLNESSYTNQFSLLQHLIHNSNPKNQTWLQMHRPLWAVDQLDDMGSCGTSVDDKFCYVNQTMQLANAQFPLDKSVDLIVSGHMHRFQVVDFKSSKHADQLVVGNSGVKLSGMHPKKTTKLKIDSHKATVMGVDQFGYMTFNITSKNWLGELINPNLETPLLMKCDSKKTPLCEKN
jgi:hypothetical protein